MFTKFDKPRSRSSLTKEKHEAIAAYILDYVKRNPGKQIPNREIGELCSTPSYNISTITKQLLRMGKIRRVSLRTYQSVDKPSPLKVDIIPHPTPGIVASQVELLAKDYVWQTDAPTLKGFINWLKEDKT